MNAALKRICLLAGVSMVALVGAGCSRQSDTAVPPPSQNAQAPPPLQHQFTKPKLPPLAGPGAAQRPAAMSPNSKP